jgi:hypothetical protein
VPQIIADHSQSHKKALLRGRQRSEFSERKCELRNCFFFHTTAQ